MAQPGNLLLPQQVLGAERGAGVCTTGRVPFGGSVAEELLPVAKSSFNYHYYRDCLHHHNPAAGYSHQDAAGGGPACSGVRLCPESSTLGSQRTGCVFGVPQRCCRARGELGDPQTGSQKGGGPEQCPPSWSVPCTAVRNRARPRSPRCWRARHRQPQQSALLRGSFQGGGAETCFPLLFPSSCRLLPSA